MMEARNISVDRGKRRVLSCVDLVCKPGTVTAIIGPNGAGKSTLLKALSRELPLSQGAVYHDGRDIAGMPAHALAARRAVVPQATVLSFPFTVCDVVRLGGSVPGFTTAGDDTFAMDALESLDLADFADRLYQQLSGGERQRVHFARALCQLAAAPVRPETTTCLMLDEPTSNLDLGHQMLVLQRARDAAEAGRIVIAVLHDLNLAAAWSDEIVLMQAGQIAARGAPSVIFDDALLSAAYGCTVRPNRPPPNGMPYLLPQSCG